MCVMRRRKEGREEGRSEQWKVLEMGRGCGEERPGISKEIIVYPNMPLLSCLHDKSLRQILLSLILKEEKWPQEIAVGCHYSRSCKLSNWASDLPEPQTCAPSVTHFLPSWD